MKQKLRELKGETDKHTVIAGDLNTPLLAIGRTIKQKILKGYRIIHSTNKIYLTYIETTLNDSRINISVMCSWAIH